jgi:hypothetical protein
VSHDREFLKKTCEHTLEVENGSCALYPGSVEEYLHLLGERLSHQPSFECFGGHFEFAPPLPQFWQIHWETLEER